MAAMAVLNQPLPFRRCEPPFVMTTERRYSIILERSSEVLLENALMAQLEAFWDANDARYVGLRLENEHSAHARVIVTDEIPDEDEAEF
ncbi:hypothetical protein D3C76_161580 [compost metagenome]